jgi:hypothetical protein
MPVRCLRLHQHSLHENLHRRTKWRLEAQALIPDVGSQPQPTTLANRASHRLSALRCEHVLVIRWRAARSSTRPPICPPLLVQNFDKLRQGRSDQGSSPCSTPPRSPSQTPASSRH